MPFCRSVILLVLAFLPAFAQKAVRVDPNVLLHIVPGELINGVPASFTFVFVNASNGRRYGRDLR